MRDNCNSTKDSFQIFLTERNIPDPDEMLGKALKYLKDKGKNVSFKGFDINNIPIVEIDNILYSFDKCFGPWQSAKFTKFQGILSDSLIDSKKSKIESFYSKVYNLFFLLLKLFLFYIYSFYAIMSI